MMRLAYSLVEHVKANAATGRRFSGVASSPEVDRVGDSIVMSGATYAPEIPLLLFHRHDQPVGSVRLGRPTATGIPFDAVIPDIEEIGATRDRCNEAAAMVKNGLIRAVSIGFRALDEAIERLANGGVKFLKIEILELSLVSVPANSQATITNVRSICRGPGCAVPRKGSLPVVRVTPAPPKWKPGDPVRLIVAAAEPKRPWEPPKGFNDEWQAAWRRFYRKTGIVPKTYRHEERSILAHEVWKDNPASLTDDDLAYIAYMFQDDAIKAYEDRDKARAAQRKKAEAKARTANIDSDQLFVTRKVHDDAVTKLTAQVAALEARLDEKNTAVSDAGAAAAVRAKLAALLEAGRS